MRQVDVIRRDRFVARSVLHVRDVGAAVLFMAFLVYVQSPYNDMAEWLRHALTTLAIVSAVAALSWRRGASLQLVSGSGEVRPGQCVIEIWRGIPFPIWRRITTVEPTAVLLERAVVAESCWHFYHIISVVTLDQGTRYVLHLSDISRAHALAESLAGFLGVELRDRTEEIEYRIMPFFLGAGDRDACRSRWYARMSPSGKLDSFDRRT